MRKLIQKLWLATMVTILSTTMLFSACDKIDSLSASGFELGHYDGSDTSNGYDTDLLYRNNSELWGGDSGVIWVSEEDGEKLAEKGIVDKDGESYGGYFYQYQSSCGGVASYGHIIDEPNLGKGSTYIMCTRSRDLNDWEICGAVDSGMALFVGQYEWLLGQTWASECIQLPWDMKTPDGEPAPYAGKFMLYFCGSTKVWTPELGKLGAIYGMTDGEFNTGNFMMAIAISDTPVGPFRLVNSENVYGNENAKRPVTKDYYGNDYYGIDDGVHEVGVVTSYNPAVMFNMVTEDMTSVFSPIDLSPMMDDDGHLYLYFVKHSVANNFGYDPTNGNNCWGIRMTDPITPDFSSLRKLVQNGQREYGKALSTQVVWRGEAAVASGMSEKEALQKYPVWRDYPLYVDPTHASGNYAIKENGECPYEYVDTFADGTKFESDIPGIDDGYVAEAPQVIKTTSKDGDRKYIMTYSPYGVGYDFYNVKWAYSDSPLGPFMKPNIEDRFLYGYDSNTSYMTGIGHSQYLDLGDEFWFVGWEGDRPHTTNTNPGRIFTCEQASWQYYEKYDIYLPIANGPSKTLQALPQVATGYTNVASRAKVTVSNGDSDTVKYLNDGMVVATELRKGKEFSFNGSTIITLTFDTPVIVRGLFIYNAYDINYAFKNVKMISFTLAEKPSWYEGIGNGLSCYIRDLGFAPAYIDDTIGYSSTCAASLATFNEIRVSKIQIEISEAYGSNTRINISDIRVLGK